MKCARLAKSVALDFQVLFNYQYKLSLTFLESLVGVSVRGVRLCNGEEVFLWKFRVVFVVACRGLSGKRL